MDIKRDVQNQFGANAAKYVTSRLHAQGEDLRMLTEWAAAERKDRALDIATGGGHVANALAAFVPEVTACDLTQEMLEHAQAFLVKNGHTNVQMVRGDAEALPFKDNVFGLVTCRIAAHHFPDADAFAREAFRVLEPEGSFLLIDNVAPENDEWDQFYNTVEKKRDKSHFRAWKKSEWIKRLEASGFVLERMQVFAKTFGFADWSEKMGLPAAEIRELEAFMLNASEETRNHFRVKTEAGRIESFQGEAVLLLARKRG